jgi:hypothetical protein
LPGNRHCGKPQELKNQIGPESGAARSRIRPLANGRIVRMGRLLETVSDGSARLMIDVRPLTNGRNTGPGLQICC